MSAPFFSLSAPRKRTRCGSTGRAGVFSLGGAEEIGLEIVMDDADFGLELRLGEPRVGVVGKTRGDEFRVGDDPGGVAEGGAQRRLFGEAGQAALEAIAQGEDLGEHGWQERAFPRGDRRDKAVGFLAMGPEDVEAAAPFHEFAQRRGVGIDLAMAIGALGPLVAQAGEEIALAVARREPDFQFADLRLLECADIRALAQHHDLVAERRDRLGQLPRRAAFRGAAAPVFLRVPAGEEGYFQGAHPRTLNDSL